MNSWQGLLFPHKSYKFRKGKNIHFLRHNPANVLVSLSTTFLFRIKLLLKSGLLLFTWKVSRDLQCDAKGLLSLNVSEKHFPLTLFNILFLDFCKMIVSYVLFWKEHQHGAHTKIHVMYMWKKNRFYNLQCRYLESTSFKNIFMI